MLVRSTILRTGFARRGLSSLCIRPTTFAVVEGLSKHDFQPSLVVGGTFSSMPQPRFFSDKASADALVDMLNREHAEEIENRSTDVPEVLKDLHHLLTTETGWNIVSDDVSAMTKLYKTVDSVKVQVGFHCQDATERMTEEEEEEEEPEEEESASVRCTVSITKGGKTMFLVCIAQDAMIRIQSAAMAGAVTDLDALHASGADPSLYQGPEFSELAEDLQDAFHGYIEEYLGINNDVASYVAMQFDYKEQCQYVKFLEESKDLFS